MYGPFSSKEMAGIVEFDTIEINGKHFFNTKKALMKVVNEIVAYKKRVKLHTLGYDFSSPFLRRALILHHPRFKGNDLITEKFSFVRKKRSTHRSLSVSVNDGWWCSFSKDELSLEEITAEKILNKLMDNWWTEIRPKIRDHFDSYSCWRCQGFFESLEVDHCVPQHKEIKTDCLLLLESLPIEIKEGLVHRFKKVEFRNYIPYQNDLIGLYYALSRKGTYAMLCMDCHKITTKERRTNPDYGKKLGKTLL